MEEQTLLEERPEHGVRAGKYLHLKNHHLETFQQLFALVTPPWQFRMNFQ